MLRILRSKKIINKTIKLLLIFWPYLFVIFIIVLPWFLKSGFLFFTDNVWGSNIGLDWHSPSFLFNLILNFFLLIFPVDILQKIFITFVLFIIIFAGRAVVKSAFEIINHTNDIKESELGLIFILSIFSLFNPFVYDRALYGQFGILAAYGLFLFSFAYLIETWRTLDFNKLIFAAFFSSFSLMFASNFIFLLLLIYIIIYIGLFLKLDQIKNKGIVCKFCLFSILSFFIILIVNLNWVSAIILNSSPMSGLINSGVTNQDLIAFQTSGRNGIETFTNVLLMSGFWGKDQFRYLDITDFSGWQRSFIFLLPVILYGIYLSFRERSKKEKIFSLSLILIFILSILLAVGIKSPITNSFSMFLYDYVPLYKGLREPQKWVAVIIPIYLFYLTLGTYKISKFKFIADNKFICGFILAVIILMQAPSLFWGFNSQVKSTPYPSDWYEVNNLLINKSVQPNKCNERILFLPWHMYMSFNWVGKIIANPASTFFTCQVLSGTNMEFGGIYDNSQDSEGMIIDNWLAAKGNNGLPNLTPKPIRYIILAKEVDYHKYSWIKDLSYVKPLVETKTLFVYEIK